jgi:hypothetical protein
MSNFEDQELGIQRLWDGLAGSALKGDGLGDDGLGGGGIWALSGTPVGADGRVGRACSDRAAARSLRCSLRSLFFHSAAL